MMNKPNLLPKQNIIFDFDGTLVNTPEFLLPIFRKVAMELGIDLEGKDLTAYRDKTIFELLTEFKINKIKLPWLKRQVSHQLTQIVDKLSFQQGVLELLLSLQKHDFLLGIVSSSPRQNIIRFLKTKHALSLFQFVASEQSLFGKHRVLAKLLREQGLNKKQSVYVGDEIRDIRACDRIGLDVIAVAWGLNSQQALASHQPSFLISQAGEIEQLLV